MADFIFLINYLKADELQVIEKYLKGDRINYIVKDHGGTVGYMDSDYYQIWVSVDDFSKGKIIAKNFKSKIKKDSEKCPKCKSEEIERIESINFFQKFFSLGTKRVRCRKCKTKFVV